MTAEVFIYGGRRTPFGRFWGALRDLSAPRLGSLALRQLLVDTAVPPEAIDAVYMGEVLTAGVGQNPARQAAIYAGLPKSCPAETFNKVCASSLVAMRHAANLIALGQAELIIAGGMESMSRAPYLLPKPDKLAGDQPVADLLGERPHLASAMAIDSMIHDGLCDIYEPNLPHMGALADLAAATHNISREEQDTYALASHARALQAQSEGHLASQLVAVSTSGAEFCSDEGVREPDLTKLAGLAPAFGANGTVTAGSASQIADGAAAVLLGSAAAGESHGLTPLARLAGIAVWSQEPRWYTTAPVGAIRKLLDGAGLRIAEIDRYEINEAFAVVPLYAMRELGIAHERVNVWGGAIAMGHPIGASGARIALNLAHALRATDGRYGIAAACNGGGEAVALLLETVQAP